MLHCINYTIAFFNSLSYQILLYGKQRAWLRQSFAYFVFYLGVEVFNPHRGLHRIVDFLRYKVGHFQIKFIHTVHSRACDILVSLSMQQFCQTLHRVQNKWDCSLLNLDRVTGLFLMSCCVFLKFKHTHLQLLDSPIMRKHYGRFFLAEFTP